jgi:beta-lactamase class A
LISEEAARRLAQVYSLTPVELRIQANGQAVADASTAAIVHIDPLAAGQQLDLGGMLARAGENENQVFLPGFWAYLWNHPRSAVEVPLACAVDDNRLRQYLSDLLAGRYGQPATRARPVPGDVLYLPGQPGAALDIDEALPRIREALCSASARTVEMNTTASPALSPDPALLQPVLDALIQGSMFDGVIELYYQDLSSGSEFTTAWAYEKPISPGIAFTAASTIKIPVMVSAFKHIDGEMPADLRQQMALMIDLSDNGSTDEVMQRVLDTNIAPVQVTEDIRALGLQDTFLAGFFSPGAPLLNRFETPANQRADITTDPDIYNQTTATDMGRLLAMIQRCAESGAGPLVQAFPGQVTQAECQEMVALLSKNKKGVLIENGLPEGTRMARKYGWVTDPLDGLMHSSSDATLVITPGGDFVLTAYLYHPEQLQWDEAQRLTARLATAVNNFYNGWQR